MNKKIFSGFFLAIAVTIALAWAPFSFSYSFTRDLTIGSAGDDVSALQQILINEGYLKIDKPTGYFGSLTKDALAKFQEAKGISPALGYFGAKTKAYLNVVYTTESASGPAYVFTNNLTVGSTGADVSAFQQILIDAGFLKIDKPTGYFGAQTKNALIDYQSSNGISPATGYFGPITREYMSVSLSQATSTNLNPSSPSDTNNSSPSSSAHTGAVISVSIKASSTKGAITILYNTSTTLDWSSVGATACVGSGGWSGDLPPSGSTSTGNLTIFKLYNITCAKGGNYASDSVAVYVAASSTGGVARGGAPKINSLTPPVVSTGVPVKITGSGFGPHGNNVITSYGDYMDLQSEDGKTLYFPAACPTGANLGVGIPVKVHVENDNGKSNEKVMACTS